MQVTELQQQLQEVQKRVDELEGQLSRLTAKDQMQVPGWAESAVQSAAATGLIDTPVQGSYDFYRMLTVLQRLKLL